MFAKLKKWSSIAVALALVVSQVSCKARRTDYAMADVGIGYCDSDTVGQIDIYVKRSDAQPDLFEIYASPAYLVEEGFFAQFNVFNSTPASKPLLSEVVLYTNQANFLGYLSTEELEFYDEMAITPADRSTTFLEQQTDQFVRCNLPLPGEGVDYEGNVIGARAQ